MSNNYEFYAENTKGRDFIVGDLHGSFKVLLTALTQANFNIKTDRLFCCGDLVDRGPESTYVLDFLNTGFVHSVRGNHEQMFIDLYTDGTPDPAVLNYMCQHNGMNWWLDLNESEQLAIVNKFKQLPYAIEVETSRGNIGIVHADVPFAMGWDEFKENLNKDDVRENCLWNRARIENNDCSGVKGIGRVYVGHTPQSNGLKKYGNVYAIDTGAVFGYVGNASDCKLTMINIACSTQMLTQPKQTGLIDLMNPDSLPTNPFGLYGLNSL